MSEINLTIQEAIERIRETRNVLKVMHMMRNDNSEEDITDYRERFRALMMAEEALKEKMDDGK